MTLRRERIGLPLLQRELTELSARPRTFITRTLYAVVFFGLIAWQFGEQFSQTDIDALRDLGRGRELFDRLMMWQLGGVCIFMPILSSGAIAGEKERGTLQLLMITHLSPFLILVEKLGSRVFVMLTLLLLAIPVTAYAYSLGGIEPQQIAGSFIVLLSTAAYVGAFTLICSSFCSTATSALITTFVFGLPFLGMSAGFVVPAISSNGTLGMWIATIVTQSFFVMLFLQLARTALITRAGQPPKNLALEFFRGMDRFWNDLNRKFTGGVVVVGERRTLPEREPIAWRESHKKSLGRFRYLVRVLVAIEIPTLLVIVLNLDFSRAGATPNPVPNGLLWTVWIIACLLISIKVSSIIAGERSRQTLDVVLTTPMSGREIVRQHYHGILRLLLVLAVPILTCYSFRWIFGNWDVWHLIYLLSSLVSLLIYLPLCAWVSMLAGLWIQSQLKAILAATAGIGVWILLPLLLPDSYMYRQIAVFMFIVVVMSFLCGLFVAWIWPRLSTKIIALSSMGFLATLAVTWRVMAYICDSWTWLIDSRLAPSTLLGLPGLGILLSPSILTTGQEFHIPTMNTVVVNYAWYGFLLFVVRTVCLGNADLWLGRCRSPSIEQRRRAGSFELRPGGFGI